MLRHCHRVPAMLQITAAARVLSVPLLEPNNRTVLTLRSLDGLVPSQLPHATLVALAILSVLLLGAWWLKRGTGIYILDFQVFRAPERMRTDEQKFMAGASDCKEYTKETLDFMHGIVQRSGIGPHTYMPDALHKAAPFQCGIGPCREEAEIVLFSVVLQALAATGIHPREIGVLITNCSIFCPTPSLAAMIINHFKMRTDIISYNLGGMGCSAGLLAMSLAQDLLKVHSNKLALVVSTENLTHNLYLGNCRPMLVPPCIFRLGGAAILLSNRSKDVRRAKYQLKHFVRVNAAADDEAYQCIHQEEDEQGNQGVNLSKQLVKVAGRVLKLNITRTAPLILPLSQKLQFLSTLVQRKVLKSRVEFVPNFERAVQHICIHTGGRAVLEGLQKQLQLSDAAMAPSKAALWRYGNTSSASIWYCLAYIETARGVRRGDRVWQLSFGSGFKVNSLVLKAMRHCNTQHEAFEDWQNECPPEP